MIPRSPSCSPGSTPLGVGKTIEILKLSILEAPSYAYFTYPRLRPALLQLPLLGNVLAIGACDGTVPVGLLLAFIDSAAATGIVASVFLLKEYRRRGIAAALFERCEVELKQSGCRYAEAQFTTGRPEIGFLERLLARRGWLPPEVTTLSCKATLAILEAPFFRKFQLPPRFEIFSWKDLPDDQRNQILRSQAARPWIPEGLNPLAFEAGYEPLNSVGLRRGREVIGWVITHNRLPMSIRYTCAYVREDFKNRGIFIPLLESAIKRQIANFPGTPGTWTVLVDHEAMVRFVRRRMSPYMVSVNEVRRSSKALD